MSAYYNEHDKYAAAWLRELIKEGHIAPGIVDERSIEDILPDELVGYTQVHFFAGIKHPNPSRMECSSFYQGAYDMLGIEPKPFPATAYSERNDADPTARAPVCVQSLLLGPHHTIDMTLEPLGLGGKSVHFDCLVIVFLLSVRGISAPLLDDAHKKCVPTWHYSHDDNHPNITTCCVVQAQYQSAPHTFGNYVRGRGFSAAFFYDSEPCIGLSSTFDYSVNQVIQCHTPRTWAEGCPWFKSITF